MKIVWSPLALERVEDLARYIAADNPDAAARWVDDLFVVVERLADFPESGRMAPEVGSHRIRELIFSANRLILSHITPAGHYALMATLAGMENEV